MSQFEPLDDMGPVRCTACGELLPGWAKEYHLTECPKREPDSNNHNEVQRATTGED